MVTVSSSILSPRDDTGGAFSHAPDSLGETPRSLAPDTESVAFSKRELKIAELCIYVYVYIYFFFICILIKYTDKSRNTTT